MTEFTFGLAAGKLPLGVDDELRLPLRRLDGPGMACASTDSEERFGDEELFSDI